MMRFGYLTLGVALLAALPGYAHDAKSLHGGRLVEAGPYHVELVTKNTAIEIFLIGESDKPVDPKGFKAVAIFKLEERPNGSRSHLRKRTTERNRGYGPARQSQRGGSSHGAGQSGTATARFD